MFNSQQKLMNFFFIFVLFIYLPGFCFSLIFRDFFSAYYTLTDYKYFLFFFVLSTFIFTSYFFSIFLLSLPAIRVKKFNKLASYLFFDILSLSFFLLSFYFFLSYSSDFRHRSRLADASPLVSILWMLRPIVLIVLLSYVIHVCNGGRISKRSKVVLLLITIGLVLSLTSSLQVIIILFASILFLSPKYFRYGLSDIGILRLLFILIFVPILCVTVLAFGLGAKVGYEKVFSSNMLNILYMSLGTILPRVSSSFMSVMTAIYDLSNYTFNTYDFFSNAYWTLENRVNIVLGNSFNSEEIYTLNRFNQLHVFKGNPERAGASPGILASIFYFPKFPLGYIIICLYFSSLFVLLARKFKKHAKIGILSGAAIPLLTLYFLESPLNFFYIVDPFFFTFIFFVFFFKFVDFEYALER